MPFEQVITRERWVIRDQRGRYMNRDTNERDRGRGQKYFHAWEVAECHATPFKSLAKAEKAALTYMREYNFSGLELYIVHSRTRSEIVRTVVVEVEPTVVAHYDLSHTPVD